MAHSSWGDGYRLHADVFGPFHSDLIYVPDWMELLLVLDDRSWAVAGVVVIVVVGVV